MPALGDEQRVAVSFRCRPGHRVQSARRKKKLRIVSRVRLAAQLGRMATALTHDSSETNRLLRLAAGGDGGSLGTLLQRNEARLRRMIAFRMDPRLQGRVDPSDVIQDVCLAAAKSLLDYLSRP